MSETFIDFHTNEGKIINCSVEKKGSHFSFSYTLKTTILKNGQKILKKKNISASEYISYKSMKSKDTETIRSKRLCIIDNGVYVIVDYYMEIDGQPMIAIIQVKEQVSNIDLPSFIQVHREITDERQYYPEIMCKENYY
jgi:CYTH domain-containing protein